MPYSAIDLFSGCGGLSEGFVAEGFDVLAYVDWDRHCCEILLKHLTDYWEIENAEERVFNVDIQDIDSLLTGDQTVDKLGLSDIVSKLSDRRGVDVILGGPPCQAYSMALRNRSEGRNPDDYRNYLFESYLNLVEYFQPAISVFENVPGMLSSSPGGISITDRVSEGFRNIGYTICGDLKEKAVIDFSLYGVPQKRKRVIILALNNDVFGDQASSLVDRFYQEYLPSLQVGRRVSVEETISKYPALHPLPLDHDDYPNRSHTKLKEGPPNHVSRRHSFRDQDIFYKLARDIESGENRFTSSEELKTLYTEMTGRISNVHKYHVLRKDEPSNTIPAHLYKDGLRHIHYDPDQKRSITPREAAALQGFDDSFIFPEAFTHSFKMIGNAVPPIFSKVLAKSIIPIMEMV